VARRTWKCKKCEWINPRTKANCEVDGCAGKRPAPRRPKHQLVLEVPYSEWVKRFGAEHTSCGGEGCEYCEQTGKWPICNVCERPWRPGQNALHRDHDHRTGEMRGLLCHRCNRALPNWMTPAWLERALAYLRRSELAQNDNTTSEGSFV